MPIPYLGVSYLAIQHKNFPHVQALKVYENVNKPALSFLWGTFGKNKKGFIHYLDIVKDRPHVLQVHMMNGSCQRKNICRAGELTRASTRKYNNALQKKKFLTMRRIRKRLNKIYTTISPYTFDTTTLIISPCLEDNFTTMAAENFIRELKRERRLYNYDFQISRNPVSSGSRAGARYLEFHGYRLWWSGAKNIANLDGTDINFPHRRATIPNTISPNGVRRWLREGKPHCHTMLLWSALHQGITGSTTTSPPPRRRSIAVPPRDVLEMNRYLREAQRP